MAEIKISAGKGLGENISFGSVGTKDHSKMKNLDYKNSGHTGFQKELTFDDTPTENSDNPVKSSGIKTELDKKADSDSVYTKTESDTKLADKADKANENDGFNGGSGSSSNNGAAVGAGAYAHSGGAVGSGASTATGGAIGSDSVSNTGGAIGKDAQTNSGGAVGNSAYSNDGFAGGFQAKTGNGIQNAIQLGTGTNNNMKTLQVYDYQLLDADGHIPNDRMPTKADKSASVPRTTVSGYPIALTDALNDENIISCKIYGNTGGVGDLDADTGKYKIPIKIQGKNLIPYPYIEATRTKNGVTFTVNEDGTITVSGTATANASFSLASAVNYTLPKKVYFWSGCPAGGSTATYNSYVNILKRTETNWKIVKTIYDYGNGTVVDLQQYDYDGITITINVTKDTTMNNAVFKPLLEESSGAGEYEKYMETVTEISLNEPLQAGEFTNVSSLKTINSDRNYISCDTAVAPSKIDLEYYQDINKVIAEIKAAILSNGGNV